MYHFALGPAIWLQGKPFPRIPSVGRVKKLQSKQLDCGILSLLVKMNTTNAAFNRRSGADGRFMFCMFCLHEYACSLHQIHHIIEINITDRPNQIGQIKNVASFCRQSDVSV